MTYDPDHREKLFLEFKENHSRLEDLKLRIREQSTLLEELHAKAHELECEHNFLRRVVHLNITEDMDPVLAKFKVSDEQKNEHKSIMSGSASPYIIVADDRPRFGKLGRMIMAIKEIWKHG